MGLGNNSGGNTMWLAVKEGAFIHGKKGETLTNYKSLDGTIVGIEFRDKEWQGNTWREVVLSVADAGTTYKFGVGVGTGYGKQLLSKVAVADVTRPMTFEPTYKEENAKKMAGFFVTQGKALKQMWTRDNPNGMPQMVPITDTKGKVIKWDDSDQVEFIEGYYSKNVIPKLSGAPAATSTTATTSDDEPATDEDEIPF